MFEILLGRGEAGFFQSLANDDVKVNKTQRISTKIDRFRTRRPFVNLGIGIGIGTDTTNAVISSAIRPMDTKFSRVVI